MTEDPSPRRSAPSGAPSPRSIALRAAGVALALFGATALAARYFKSPLESLGRGFIDRFGLPGMALGSFLADGVLLPVPPQFYLFAAITTGRDQAAAFAAVCAGSLAGGALMVLLGRSLTRFKRLRRWVERSRPRVDALFARYGVWAVAVVSATPVPYSYFACFCGAYRVRPALLLALGVCRVPRLLAFYALIRLGWSL